MNKQQSAKARERRLRKKYAKKMRFGIIVALVIGLAGGFAAGRYTAKLTDRQPGAQVEATPLVPSLEATPEATEAVPTEPTAGGAGAGPARAARDSAGGGSDRYARADRGSRAHGHARAQRDHRAVRPGADRDRADLRGRNGAQGERRARV